MLFYLGSGTYKYIAYLSKKILNVFLKNFYRYILKERRQTEAKNINSKSSVE